ncbi:MAG: pyruvate dehydrogenase (acetyl-transferring) E1 component subunit alpha [Alphaproteobacteria bacterium]|nr:pyruvate dehydrogenase (acetyl-transferring) E1 component subunit alpha [Alphaproteobacteria bacterium]
MPAKLAKKTPSKSVNLVNKKPFTKKQLLDVYSQMSLLRRFEEKAATMYQQGKIGGFCHLYIGQEAVVTGIRSAGRADDDQITSYRCHAHAIACGVEPEQVMAELMGKETGISKGKGGSMHMFEPSKHFWGGHGIVAAQVPLGAGLAFASKYRGEDRASFAYIGDGAMNGGQVYETFNMAALWKLPVVFVIENNQYAMGTSTKRGSAGEFYKRAEPFGIPAKRVDGMDFFEVHAATTEALKHVRAGKGPYLLEMDTYRYRGHSMSDPAKYRTRDEVDDVKKERDPIEALAELLGKEYGVKDDELKKLDKASKETVNVATEKAMSASAPDAREMWTDVLPENGGQD